MVNWSFILMKISSKIHATRFCKHSIFGEIWFANRFADINVKLMEFYILMATQLRCKKTSATCQPLINLNETETAYATISMETNQISIKEALKFFLRHMNSMLSEAWKHLLGRSKFCMSCHFPAFCQNICKYSFWKLISFLHDANFS